MKNPSLTLTRRNLYLFTGAGLAIAAVAVAPLAKSDFSSTGAIPESTAFTGGSLDSFTIAPAAVQTRFSTIPVANMSCMSCAAKVKRAATSVAGVVDAKIQFADKTILLSYDSQHADAPSRAAAAINKLGYRAGMPISRS